MSKENSPANSHTDEQEVDAEGGAHPSKEEQALDSGFPTLEQMAALLPQYEFHDVLGVGGMGAVYLARQTTLDRWVAIKLLPQSASLNAEDASRFITEARSMAKLTHANIAAVYEFGQTVMGHLFLVMEHVQGVDLHRRIHRGEVTPQRIKSLVSQLCDALQYAHNHKVIHRDIKPANILITEDWEAKIVDFGLAGDNAVTANDLEYGTPDYVAPERLVQGATVDHRVDIYALGVVIHEMFTKTTPLAAGSSAYQGMPEIFCNVVARCIAADPAKRFQACSDLKNHLAKAETGRSGVPSPDLPSPAQPAPTHISSPAPLEKPLKKRLMEDDDAVEGTKSSSYLWAAAAVVLLTVGYWFMQNQGGKTEVVVASKDSELPAEPKAKPPVDTPPPIETAPKSEAPKTANMATKDEIPKKADEEAKGPEMATQVPAAVTPVVVEKVSAGPFKPEPGEFSVISRLSGHRGSVYSCAILDDQRRIVSGGSDGLIRVWDARTGALIKSIPSPFSAMSGLSYAPGSGLLLAYTNNTHEVAILDVNSGAVTARVKAPNGSLEQASWAPDGKVVHMLVRHVDGGVYFWDPARQDVVERLSGWNYGTHEILPFVDEFGARQWLVTGGSYRDTGRKRSDGSPLLDSGANHAAIFSADDRRLLRMLPDYRDYHPKLIISGDGKRVSGGTSNFGIFDPATMRKLLTISPPAGAFAQSSAWLDGSRLLLVAWNNGDLSLHEGETGQELAKAALAIRGGSISISKDMSWAAISGYSLGTFSPSAPLDVVVVRLPDVSKLGSEKGRVTAAARQLAKLDTLDPPLAALRDSAVTAPDAITTDELLVSAVRELTTKYGLALKRAALTASPKEQIDMKAEAEAVAKGAAVPNADTDSATSGEHKRFRGIYRQQLAALEVKRQQGVESLRKSIQSSVQAMAKQRLQSGDEAGAARCDALLASYADMRPFAEVIATAFTGEKTASPSVASASITPAPSGAAPARASRGASTSGVKLTRQGKPGELIKIERTIKNGYFGDSRSRVGSVPPNLGPVWQVTCNNYHGLVILADGSLKGWGSWSGAATAYITPPEVKDAVMIATTLNESAAVLGDNTVIMWNENGEKETWTPPGGAEIRTLFSQQSWGFYVMTADGRIHAISSLSIVTDGIPPPAVSDVISAAGSGLDSSGVFAVKKDGSILHWGKENLYIGQQHLSVKDGLAVAVSNNFLCVLRKDGSVDGWGETRDRQRFRSRKYPGAMRLLPDPAGRVFIVEKPGGEWSVLLNPANDEYAEEQRLGTIEGKLKGCTSVSLGSMFVFAVKPVP